MWRKRGRWMGWLNRGRLKTVPALLCLLGLLLAACEAAPLATIAPTQTLILAPDTATPPPTPPPPTPPPLSAPGEVGATPSPTPLSIPAAAQPLVEDVVADLAARLNVETGALQLMLFETASWTTIDLGCGDDPMGSSELRTRGYRIVLSYAGAPYEYHTDETSRIRLCPAGSAAAASDLLLTDPIAAELVSLAQRQLATLLDISARRVELVAITPYAWAETSLGCPLPEQTYSARHIDGYRIVVRAGGSDYIFHSDFDRVVLCDPANEVLPE